MNEDAKPILEGLVLGFGLVLLVIVTLPILMWLAKYWFTYWLM